MRKLYLLFTLCALATLSSCKENDPAPTPEPTPEPTYEGTELPHLSGIYFGNNYGATESDYNYSLALSTAENCFDIVTGESILAANNTYLYIDLYSSTPSDNYNISFTIPEGEYLLDTEDSATAGTLSATYTCIYVTNDEEGVETHFVSGKVVVTKEHIEASFVDAEGNEYNYYSTDLDVDNSTLFAGSGMYGEFSTLEGDHNIEFSYGALYAECYGDYYVIGKNSWTVYIDDYATNEGLTMEILTPFSDEAPVGEFEVSSNLNLERLALPGFVDGYGNVLWSWYKQADENYDVICNAPIKSGKVTIADNGDGTHTATIDVVDDKGFKISGTCTAYFEVYGYMASTATRSSHSTKPSRR